ncbi:BAG domain-containing protein [Abeliophyllum distichum]|uniref:BAG domain-containing protein n=1 Tax=Abeliophyllum distichum TaxID=126358 RepID=A0ABD1W183_9LAMI
MDYSPFFTNHWSQQQPLRRQYTRSPSVRGIPVHSAARPAHPIQHPPVKTSTPKVVQIPVHFVGSESTREASALKIQKVFRGFLVRKSVKKIKDVKVQVDGIEERLLKSEVVELIKRYEKERLKMNESLMALLFKLDSIRGVDLGVRDFRKAVIRKAIALQEKIDAAASVNSENVSEINEVDDQALEIMDCAGNSDTLSEKSMEVSAETDPEKSGNENSDILDVRTEHAHKLEDSAENHSENLGNSTENSDKLEVPTDDSDKMENVNSADQTGECMFEQSVETDEAMECLENCRQMEAIDVNSADQTGECMFEQSVVTEDKAMECLENCRAMEAIDVGVDCEVKVDEENCTDNRVEEEGKLEEGGSGVGKSDRELFEKMMAENAKMMDMMTQLSGKNEKQTQMLNALTRRVELLEKAFVCDILRRKKKKNSA